MRAECSGAGAIEAGDTETLRLRLIRRVSEDKIPNEKYRFYRNSKGAQFTPNETRDSHRNRVTDDDVDEALTTMDSSPEQPSP